jgi:hypothetical protein
MVENSIINTNSNQAKWRFTVFLLVTALCIEIYLLIFDIPFLKSFFDVDRGTVSNNPQIAQLMTKQNSVRTQPEGDLVWEDAQQLQQLYLKDSVLTLENSKAEVAFLDGTGLIIAENSLIQLERSDLYTQDTPGTDGRRHHFKIRLLRGSIRKLRQKHHSTSATMEFSIEVGNIQAKTSADSELTIMMLPESKGSARFIVENGNVQVQTPEQKLNIKNGEEASVSARSKHHEVQLIQSSTFKQLKDLFTVNPLLKNQEKAAIPLQKRPTQNPTQRTISSVFTPPLPPPPSLIFKPQIKIKPTIERKNSR